MKQSLLLLLAALLCLSAACAAQPEPSAQATEAPAETETPAETEAPSEDEIEVITDGEEAQPTAEPSDDSDTDLMVDDEEEDDSATDAPMEAEGFSDLPLEQCVEDAWPYPGVLPHIVLDCPGAEQINAAIDETFTEIADDPMWELRYEIYKGARRVLSVLMVQKMNDNCYYTSYNLDLVTGEALTGPELLALLGVDETELAELEREQMGALFDSVYEQAKESTDPAFFQGQRDITTGEDNADLERVWLGEADELYFAGRIYGIAGAEYYEYPMATGLTF